MANRTFPTYEAFLTALLAAGGSSNIQTSASGRSPQGGPSSLKPDVRIMAQVGTGYEMYESPPRDWSTEDLRTADIDALAKSGGGIFNDATCEQRLAAMGAIEKLLFNPNRLVGVTGRKFVINGAGAMVTKVALRFLDRPGVEGVTAPIVDKKDCDIYLHASRFLSPDKVIFNVGLLIAWLSMFEASTFDSLDQANERCYSWSGFGVSLSEDSADEVA